MSISRLNCIHPLKVGSFWLMKKRSKELVLAGLQSKHSSHEPLGNHRIRNCREPLRAESSLHPTAKNILQTIYMKLENALSSDKNCSLRHLDFQLSETLSRKFKHVVRRLLTYRNCENLPKVMLVEVIKFVVIFIQQ